ncbi:hypothetical protein D3C81_2017880 [compost metagenome]
MHDGACLVIGFFTPGEAEQMDFVVALDALTGRVVHHHGVQDFVRHIRRQRQGTAYQPDLMFACSR